MYLKKLSLENVGPLEDFLLEPSFFEEGGNPKPVVLVGENGSGKSIVLSYIVNGLMAAKQSVYADTEVETGKVYKFRSPDYVSSGKIYSYGRVDFEDELNYFEWQLLRSRKSFEEEHKFTPVNKEWNQIPENNTSYINSTFHIDPLVMRNKLDQNVLLYFPPNRFEIPLG